MNTQLFTAVLHKEDNWYLVVGQDSIGGACQNRLRERVVREPGKRRRQDQTRIARQSLDRPLMQAVLTVTVEEFLAES